MRFIIHYCSLLLCSGNIIHFLYDQDFFDRTGQDRRIARQKEQPQSRMRIGKKAISPMLFVTYTMSVVRQCVRYCAHLLPSLIIADKPKSLHVKQNHIKGFTPVGSKLSLKQLRLAATNVLAQYRILQITGVKKLLYLPSML